MTVGHINVKETIERIKKEISSDQSISPALISSIELLIVVIQMLLDRQSMNSTNSSLAPSGDKKNGRGKDKKKRKKKGKRSVGGQPGHVGATLTQYEDADEIIELSIDRKTLPRGMDFKSSEPETRQIIDLNLEFVIREYQAEVLVTDDGERFVAKFPAHIKKSIQYGPSVKSLAVYMSQYQLIPYKRVQEVFEDQFDLKISQGTLCNFNREAFERLESFEVNMVEKLKKEEVLNTDETGIKINGTLAWAHVVCTPTFTLMYPHEKRGKEAINEMNIIPLYKGILIHDHWKPYLSYNCLHGLCNAHHLRELQWVIDYKEHKWASSLKRFLIKLNKEVHENGGILDEQTQKKRTKRYREITKAGNKECAFTMPTEGSGKTKVAQTKERNLLTRLQDYTEQVLLFMKVRNVPFTNNQAERDIRMIKVHQKVSSQFKTIKTARYFCRIRSFIITSKKKGHSPYDKLTSIFATKN